MRAGGLKTRRYLIKRASAKGRYCRTWIIIKFVEAVPATNREHLLNERQPRSLRDHTTCTPVEVDGPKINAGEGLAHYLNTFTVHVTFSIDDLHNTALYSYAIAKI
jgi:hypothetical protein